MVSNLIGNEAPLAGVAGSSPVSSALSRTETFGFFCFLLLSSSMGILTSVTTRRFVDD